MNKSALKSFALIARKKLTEAILKKADELGITNKEIIEPDVYHDGYKMKGKFFAKSQIKQRDQLVQKIKDPGFIQIIEETAYTWFNRIIAIRYMEVNQFLPISVRVLSSKAGNKALPDALSEVLAIAENLGLNLDVVYRLQEKQDIEQLYKYIFVKQCNQLAKMMPMLFEQIEDYTELLLPDRLLSENSVIHDLLTMVTEEDWKGQVEIIGWLYQHYISEQKGQIFADLKKNKKIAKENIPAATQLFTPKWIVRYMVENSLGKLWLETHPNDTDLKKQWEFYLEQPEQSLPVIKQLERLTTNELNPKNIKILDPCMGSGHILVYAFDVLYLIYQKAGYNESDIPNLILTHNLFGLDIDDRAAQLAYFALMMKARSYNSCFFNSNIKFNIISIQESNDIPKEALDFLLSLLPIDNTALREEVYYIKEVFHDAKEYGSILNVKAVNFDAIEELLRKAEAIDNDDLFTLQYQRIIRGKLLLLVNQMKVLSQKYTITITNPPYMGFKGMNHTLYSYLKKHYPDSKTDLYAVFLEKLIDYTKENGFSACITQHSWMFLSRYEKLRTKILNKQTIYSMVHLGPKAFEEIGGEVVQTAAYVGRNTQVPKLKSPYIRLVIYDTPATKKLEFFHEKNKYVSSQDIYLDLPNFPIAYWISENAKNIFKNNHKLITIATPNTGLQTSNNDRFLRFWFEIDQNHIGFNINSNDDSIKSKKKWFPYNKGGSYRKWYGNQEYVVNWENNGLEIRKYNKYLNSTRSSNIGIGSVEFYFRESISWSKIGTAAFSVRYSPAGFIFDVGGSSLFPSGKEIYLLLALLNSKTTVYFLSLLNPTMNFQVGNISSIPIPDWTPFIDKIEELSKENIMIAKNDWDSYEISWNFARHPFVLHNSKSVQEAYKKWSFAKQAQRTKLKNNEETLNKLFVKMYGLKDEINPFVSESELTLEKENLERDIKSFISYAIGCMLGRYSLEGVVLSGEEFDRSNNNLFNPKEDNIIPINDDDYFEDDIVNCFIRFVSAVYGQESLEENLTFISDALSKKEAETSRQRLRRYFVKEFYQDHLQTYQKRPIYWMFNSGKNDAFKVLIYMHRYHPGMMEKVREDYLHKLIQKYEAKKSNLEVELKSNVLPQEKTKAKKQKEKIQKQLAECQQYDQIISYIVNQHIDFDLDDGVKVNYERFQNMAIPQTEGKKTLKANLLAKVK